MSDQIRMAAYVDSVDGAAEGVMEIKHHEQGDGALTVTVGDGAVVVRPEALQAALDTLTGRRRRNRRGATAAQE